MYHSLDTSGSVVSVAPKMFADQMSCISDMGFRGISLSDAVSHLEANGSWPSKSVVLTFDDGFANFHENALGPLTQYGLSATVFLISNYVGGQNTWDTPPEGLGTRSMLNWEQVVEVAAAGVEIGAHTHNHPNLRTLPDARVDYEIVESRIRIEDHLNSRVESFAYPYGAVSSAAARVAAREFRSACTTVLRPAHREPMHLLPRIDMHYVRSLNSFRRLLIGHLDHYLTARRWGRTVRRALIPGS